MLGFLKAFGMLFVILFLLPVWFVRGVAARARFRRELRLAGVPEDAAWRLSERYKIRFRDFAGMQAAADDKGARRSAFRIRDLGVRVQESGVRTANR